MSTPGLVHPAPATALRRWAWVPVLAAGTTLFEAVRVTLIATGNEALVPTLLLVGAVAIPVTFLTYLAGRPLDFISNGVTVAMTGLAGGVIGVVLAGLLEFDTLNGLGVGQKLGVAVIEESAKLIAPAYLLVLGRTRGGADGLILGAASGAGFATLETMGYAFTTIVNHHGDLTEVSQLLLVRGIWSPAGHMAWTGIIAWALYRAVEQQFLLRSCGLLVAAAAAAVTLHTAWDSLQTPPAYAVIATLGLATLAAALHWQSRIDTEQLPAPRR